MHLLAECMAVHVMTKEGVRTHYVHRMVIMYVVGRLHSSAVQVILGAEPALRKDALEEGEESPGHEGESTAAKRLIEKMIALYGNHFFDVLPLMLTTPPNRLCYLWILWVSIW